MWGTSWRQRLRLAPLYVALLAADGCARCMPRQRIRHDTPWPRGLSIVIPERAAPDLLEAALAATANALTRVDEDHEIIVVVNGAPLSDYAALRERYPATVFLHSSAPLGFGGAVELGVAHARYEGVYLLNNDMVVEAEALAAVLALRAPDVFAIGSQIEQRSADGRREETGFVDWFIDRAGIRLFHANVPDDDAPREHLAASGGAALFRRGPLRTYLRATRAYAPFYWEDAEWGVQAWRDGWRVLFCPRSRARHRHRATTARFYSSAELDRIVERNRWLFDARNGLTPHGGGWLMAQLCALPYASQRELSAVRVALATWRQRVHRYREPQPLPPSALAHPDGNATTLHSIAYSFHLRTPSPPAKPCLLLVTPFAVFPPRHGGARRVAALIAGLRDTADIVLVTDEAFLYDARSFAFFDGLCAVHLVQRIGEVAVKPAAALPVRMRAHAHPALEQTVINAIRRHSPQIVQIEHAELALLARRRTPAQRWVLDLHDAYTTAEFGSGRTPLDDFDAVTVVSAEDAALVAHSRVVIVRNGSDLVAGAYQPSAGLRLLFIGPFRYAPNRDGILRFLTTAWPLIQAQIPATTLLVLAGDEFVQHMGDQSAFKQPGVTVMGHRDDMATQLAQCVMTINPLAGIRGSAVKIAESLTAGRVCVSTVEGARGYVLPLTPGVVTANTVDAMVAPVLMLLRDSVERHRLEACALAAADDVRWTGSVRALRALHEQLLDAAAPGAKL